ncbi:MAG: hypothetical protein BMS9Abin26_0037 [Gammaproteobacteria bacterium]|nr:MAG: hypothetical protein BMS9Abin26_0037 [Gammaproteobacteria bacterium]
MDTSSEWGAGLALIVLGVMLIRLRHGISLYVMTWYRKIGIDIPEDKYAKQFVFIGVILMVLGFLAATGLVQYG